MISPFSTIVPYSGYPLHPAKASNIATASDSSKLEQQPDINSLPAVKLHMDDACVMMSYGATYGAMVSKLGPDSI